MKLKPTEAWAVTAHPILHPNFVDIVIGLDARKMLSDGRKVARKHGACWFCGGSVYVGDRVFGRPNHRGHEECICRAVLRLGDNGKVALESAGYAVRIRRAAKDDTQ